MTSHSISSSNFVDLSESKLPWGDEIWQAEGDWFTLAQLLWVKLYGSSMSYGQLHYVISTPLLPAVSSTGQVSRRSQLSVHDARPRVYEMELVMDPVRGILLIGEVYGQPGDRVWQPDKIYRRLLELGVILTEFFQRELLIENEITFCPGFVLILRDIDRALLTADCALNRSNILTRDELSTARQHLDKIMDSHARDQDVPFHAYGHLLISTLRNISDSLQGEPGEFRTADEIYQAPRLPAWLR